MFSSKKEDRPLGNEVKNKVVRKDPKYFQGLEYREVEKKPEVMKNVKNNFSDDLIVLPMGNKK